MNEPDLNPSHTVVKKKPMPFWFKLVGILVILALLCVTAGIIFTERWVDVAEEQLEALRHHDIEGAYSKYTSKEFQEATSLEEFQKFVENHPIFFHNQSAYFTQRTIKDHMRTLRGYLVSQNHQGVPIEYKLTKEDDRWKVHSFRFLKAKKQAPQT